MCLFVQSSDFLKKRVQFILSVKSLQEMIALSRTVCFESGQQKDSINQETYSQSIDKEIKLVTAYAFSSMLLCIHACIELDIGKYHICCSHIECTYIIHRLKISVSIF